VPQLVHSFTSTEWAARCWGVAGGEGAPFFFKVEATTVSSSSSSSSSSKKKKKASEKASENDDDDDDQKKDDDQKDDVVSPDYSSGMSPIPSTEAAVLRQFERDVEEDLSRFKFPDERTKKQYATTIAERWLASCKTFDPTPTPAETAGFEDDQDQDDALGELTDVTRPKDDQNPTSAPGSPEIFYSLPQQGNRRVNRNVTELTYRSSTRGTSCTVTVRADVLTRLKTRFLERKGLGGDVKTPYEDWRPLALQARDDREFKARAFAMLLRYQDLARGDAGQHGVLPKPAFDVLVDWGCQGECFATPFNATLPDFCSPFVDTDACFGSRGSFFRRAFTEGNFEINPPFSLRDDAVSTHLFACLDDAEKKDRPLAFVLIHTDAYAKVARKNLGRFLVRREEFKPGDHYYYEGAFFMKAQPRAFVPTHTTTVIFAMTSTAKAKWRLTDDVVRKFRNAFAWPMRDGDTGRLVEHTAIAS